MPVSCSVAGSGWTGTSAQENDTYQPSASRLTVTVVRVPWRGRDQRTAMRPIFANTREPFSSRAPLPYSLEGEGVEAATVAPLEAGETGLFSGRDAPEERLIGPNQSGEHVLQHMAMD